MLPLPPTISQSPHASLTRRDRNYQRSWRGFYDSDEDQQDGQCDPSYNLVVANERVQVSKRELTLVDRSNSSIMLTLWGKQAETYDDDGSNPVIAFKGVKIGEFQGET